MEVYKNRTQKSLPLSHDVMQEVIQRNPPPSQRKIHYIKFVTQLPTHSPSFAFFCNLP